MGQYYRAVLCSTNEKIALDPWAYNEGAKLMEHAYFGNQLVGTASRIITNNPTYVWWVGDYAVEEDIPNRCKALKPIEVAWRGLAMTDSPFKIDTNCHYGLDGFLVNLTTKEFVDLEHCKGEIHPLPLLTAVGNGRGGGDYRGDEASLKMVGIWAGDELMIAGEKPDSSEYIDITSDVHFSEN